MADFETDDWPFVEAKYYRHVAGDRAVRVIVIHDMEAPEKGDTAECVAKYFQHPDYTSSAHICIDNDSVVQCVHDRDVAFAAPGANNDGIHLELAGYGRQSVDDWHDEYSTALLSNAADVAAQYCLKYDIPAVQLTDEQLKDGERGIVGHFQVSAVYKQSDHTDPGPNFPWAEFIARVQERVTCRQDS